MAEAISGQPGWRFDLVVVNQGEGQPIDGETTLPRAVELEDAKDLEAAGSLDAAFLVLWLAAEGMMRLLASRAGLPLERMPTSALIRELYSAGEMAREDYDVAIRLVETRNGVVHGFSTPLSVDHVRDLKGIAEHLLAELRTASK